LLYIPPLGSGPVNKKANTSLYEEQTNSGYSSLAKT